MSERLRLKNLEISAFRGARDTVSLPLDRPLNVIFGPNGSGKSTILAAIEWALYPKQACTLGEHGIDERREWQIRHVHGKEQPSVKLVLAAGDKELIVTRRGVRPATQSPGIRCGYQDFKSLVYVHQETIRDFLVGTPKPRQEIFQRLLGAGWAQDLKEALDQACCDLRRKEVDQAVESLERVLDARIHEARRQLEEAEQKAGQQGFRRPWERAAEQHIERVNEKVASLARGVDVPAPAPLSLEPMREFSARLGPVLKQLRAQGPASAHEQRTRRKFDLETALTSYLQARQELDKRQAALDEARRRFGTEETMQAELDRIANSRAEVEAALSQLNGERELLRKALELLETQPPRTLCPVCGQPIRPEDVIEALRRKVEAALTEAEAELHGELRRLADQETQLKDARKKLAALADEARRAGDAVRAKLADLEKALGRALEPVEDPAAVAQAEIERTGRELAQLAEAVEQLDARILEIEQEGKKLEELAGLIGLEERVAKLEQLRTSQPWQQMLESQQALARREQGLKLASDALGKIAGAVARHNLERAGGTITEFYRRLTCRSDFPRVDIDPGKKYEVTVAGENASEVVTAILNLTDLNSVAVAVITGLAVNFPEVHDLDFLILDDPSQGMDPEVARRLGALIGDIARKTQVVVATPDPDLLESLQGCTVLKRIVRLQPRDPDDVRPCIRVSQVE
jgi:DNA repair exonuclease SbcCD ATPase subunit